MQPILLVGLGAFGGEVLNEARRLIRLQSFAAREGPQSSELAIEMLWVCAEPSTSLWTSMSDDCVACYIPGSTPSQVRTALRMSISSNKRMAATGGWLGESKPSISGSQGAGQELPRERSDLRTLGLLNIRRITEELRTRHQRLVAEMVPRSKRGVQVSAPIAVIVGQAADGFSSSFLQDLVEVVHGVDHCYGSPGRTITLLSTDEAQGQARGPGNALALISEIVTGVWAMGLSEETSTLFACQGLLRHTDRGWGSRCTFLIESRNEHGAAAAAQTLVRLASEPETMSSLLYFIIGNVVLPSSSVEDQSGLNLASSRERLMPFSSLAVRRLSLGMEPFIAYVEGVVTRDVVSLLLGSVDVDRQSAQSRFLASFPESQEGVAAGHALYSAVVDLTVQCGYPTAISILEEELKARLGVAAPLTQSDGQVQERISDIALISHMESALADLKAAHKALVADCHDPVIGTLPVWQSFRWTWSDLPAYDATVPDWMKPTAHEEALLEPEHFRDLLQAIVEACTQNNGSQTDWKSLLRDCILRGLPLKSPGSLAAPSQTRLFTSGTARTSERVSVFKPTDTRGQFPSSIGHVASEVQRWLMDVELSQDLGEFLKQDLAAYVDAASPDLRQIRQQAFLGAVERTVARPSTTATVSSAALAVVHPTMSADDEVWWPSAVPFPLDHPLSEPIREIMHQGRVRPSGNDYRFAPAKVDGISIWSFLVPPMMPMVFTELMAPIADQWSQIRHSADQRAAFWRGQRARPLVETIPAGPDELQAMIQGWFAGRLLGQITREDESDLGWRVQIWNPDDGTFYSFPYPLLASESVTRTEILPAILQSLPLALVDVHTQGSLGPLVPYQRLIDLGNECVGLLQDWITDGTLYADAPTPEVTIAGLASNSSLERRELVLGALSASLSEYEVIFANTEQPDAETSTSMAWELREQIRAAFQALIAAASHERASPIGLL